MRPVFRIIVIAIAMGLASCATTKDPGSEDSVSSIPWNRPQSWEGQGPLGGMLQQTGR